jgi:hypothetical protein
VDEEKDDGMFGTRSLKWGMLLGVQIFEVLGNYLRVLHEWEVD